MQAYASTLRGGALDLGQNTFASSTYHMEQFDGNQRGLHEANIMLEDGIKVDCAVISQNSKYVVTGSATGPPQVWDMRTGDLIKVMDGQELGTTDVHLAADDAILVGLVAEPHPVGVKQHRLQLWDFCTRSPDGHAS